MSSEQQSRQSSLNLWKQLRTNAIVAVLSLLAGFIVTLLATESVLDKYSKLIVALFIALTGLVFFFALTDLWEKIRDSRNEMDDKWRAIDKVPSLVTFVDRTEKITVTDEGDGIFESHHIVEYTSDHKETIDQLHFPILLDLPERVEPGVNIEVLSISVEGTELPTDAYSTKEIRRAYQADTGTRIVPQEYGIVKVPVTLNDQRSRANISVTIKLKSIFKARASRDYVIVDIPYVTKKLSVRICAENDKDAIRSPIGERIEAICEMMDLKDKTEETYQLSNVSHGPKDIQWTTENAKIGYRYLLWFRVVKETKKPLAP